MVLRPSETQKNKEVGKKMLEDRKEQSKVRFQIFLRYLNHYLL